MSNDAKKYLDSEGLSYFWEKIKDYVGEAVESGTSDIANKIHFVVPNEKEAIEALTAAVSDVDALSPGLVIALRMPFDSVASQTLNINNLGAKPIYYRNNTTDAGVFPSGAVVLLVYETTSIGTGCFKAVYSYDGAQPDVYQGATSSSSGIAGLVPAALSEEKDKFLKGDGTWAEVNTEKEVGYSTTEPTSQSTSSLDNESFVFYETESFGGDGAWDASISGNAATADSVNHAMTLTVDGGTLEGLTKYSFNGSVAKEVNLAAGNGVTLTPTYGTVTISTETYPAYQGATENANGVEGLVPAATSAEKDKYLKGDGTWEQVLSGIQNISVQEINVAKGKNAHSVDPTEWMYYNDYSTIDTDIQFLDAENQSIDKTFNADSNGITFTFPEGSEPKTLSGKVELCKGNCDYWDEIALDGISIEDLLAAGENGIFIQDAFTKNEEASAYPYQDDTNAIVCMIDNGNGSYTLKLATCETEEVAEPSLQLEKADGTIESVNMDALYGHIGGSVQVETGSVSVSNIEELPLTNYFPFNSSDNVEPPSEYPAYSMAYMMDNNSGAFLNESGETTGPSNSTITGNVAELQFRVVRDLVYSNGLPKTICPTVYCLTGNATDVIAAEDMMTMFAIGINANNDGPSSISIEDALAAVNGIELIEYQIPVVEAGSEVEPTHIPTGGDPIYLFVEKTSDDPYTLRLKVAKKETSTETTVDPVLHLEKSESSSIDLSPVYEHIGGRVEITNTNNADRLGDLLPAISGDDWPPTDYPTYEMYYMCDGAASSNANIRGGFLDASENSITPSYTVSDNITTFTFSSNEIPYFITPHVCYLRNSEDADSESIRYFVNFENGNIAHVSIEDALAATNGIQLNSYDTSSGTPVPIDEEPIIFFVEKTSENPYTLQVKLFQCIASESKPKSILHIEKSTSNEIDLSPLTNNLLTNAELSYNVQKPQVHSNDNNYSIRIDYYDENNTLISSQNYDRNSNFDSMNNDNIEITIPQNCKYFNITYDESVEGSNKNFAVYNANNIDVSNIRANYVVSSTDPEIETRI